MPTRNRTRKRVAAQRMLIAQQIADIELDGVDSSFNRAPHNQLDDVQLVVVDPQLQIAPPEEGTRQGESEAPAANVPFLVRAFNAYVPRCACGTTYANNCAHFLTNAMAIAGAKFPASVAKCPAGRMIRAKETLDWWKTFATAFRQNCVGITAGVWMVYQEYQGQGHVCLHWHTPSGYSWRGTTNLPSWPVQWHYFY